ncbi:DUF4381 domain-containing protein [Pseudidiomarina terrestris]|uniref:DUF4381 domain-containing protein n=1 Tax=Pseudidiomarina terrestris TaxID=2820060 RepID=A0AAW7QT15_9GAMM|nr:MULTISPECIES: DUF4381 domain-containing protein [unclassified Pseudidiomarina]MDN7123292.1 DUF4381 domain-containing protein [Pseudidiomarina sp. 1APP75-32.1]MDN7127875.1 DUF4381 domain-containing protein [Pseudidiomarina sp. 1APR75-33.1]MDN7128982.1 DUF4381 domain-containing protein [Pseudidiomarina sp. 1APR75-15]MDN7134755.1 DUF4381 domain-containing protein [Pseudidiomarina sp. 1ASP75-5]MDN7137433.1 DUF4381 domain-containing protein [Pseudidiomarina sp. 1ASP75-14]
MTAPEQLHDIILPPAASWWPLAPGWYVLAVVSIITVGLLTWLAVRSYRRRRVRRAALTQLSPLLPLNSTTLLLKRACLGYYPSPAIAGLTGSAWRDFLLQQLSSSQAARFVDLLVEVEHAAYQPTDDEAPRLRNEYYQFARFWMMHALPPSSTQLTVEEAK